MILTHWFAIYDEDQDGQLQLEAGWDPWLAAACDAVCDAQTRSSFRISWIFMAQDYARLVADYQLPLTAADEIYTRVVKERLAGLDS